MSKSKVLFLMSGSIACYKACQVISRLIQNDLDVEVVASSAALKFVGEATLEGLTGNKVKSDLWARGQLMDHIHLIREADIIVSAPASANFINKIAHGVGDDLLSTLFLAHDFKKPWLIAPAMNTSMYLHPITQKSIGTLRNLGLQILETASGVLACGESGLGKLLDPDLILKEILTAISHKQFSKADSATVQSRPSLGINVLVTGGGTRVPIDEVRSITNTSTGKTAKQIVETLALLGASVTFLRSRNSLRPEDYKEGIEFVEFDTYEDFSKSFQKLLSKRFSWIIHAAAVSDFSIGKSSQKTGKISSIGPMSLPLKPTKKLVDLVKIKAPKTKLVAFKLTAGASPKNIQAAVKKLAKGSRADIIIHNDTTDITPKQHFFNLYSEENLSKRIEGSAELAETLAEIILGGKKNAIST
jgi:phosphopantothenoylcysteine decarboxylase/phosphopantothenate--cysteine ligase